MNNKILSQLPETYYASDIRALPRVIMEEPIEGLGLALLQDGVEIWFAAFEWITNGIDSTEADLLFHGWGIGGSLKELRHIHWGENGYLSYMPLNKTIAVLEALKNHFGPHGAQ